MPPTERRRNGDYYEKRIVAIWLIAILLVSTLAGCSCSNSTTNNTTTTGYKCDFKNSDVAIPKGTKLTDSGLEVTDKADATVKNVLDIEKQLPVLIACDGDGEISPELKYMQETNAKKLRWSNYNAVADYTAETANQIDPTFGKVTEFGKNTFNIVRAYYKGDAEILQQMLTEGAVILQGQGVNAPAENATDAERQEYIGKLIATIEEQQNTNPNLKNFDSIMNDLINNYTLVTGELSKTNDFSPLTAYDNYWNMYFNWESQGYALREAYRGNAEFEVKRAYALIALYYNIGTENTAVVYQKYGQLLNDALTQIEQNGPGISPQVVADNWHQIGENKYEVRGYTLDLENGLYSGTFDKRLFALYDSSPKYTGDETKNGVNVSTGIVEKYVSKLHGKTVVEDLALAGINNLDFRSTMYGTGVMFNISKKDKKKWIYDLVTWDGNLIKDESEEEDDWEDHNRGVYDLK